MRIVLLGLSWLLCFTLPAQNAAPAITALLVSVDGSGQLLQVRYDVADPENDSLEVRVFLSDDGGRTYTAGQSLSWSGDVGFPVFSGSDRQIQADLSGLGSMPGTQYTVRLVVRDLQPFDLAGLVAEVDSNRLRNDLSFVEGVRHRGAGPAHLQAVRDSLLERFSALGLYAGEHTFLYNGYTGRNLIGIHPGAGAAEQVVVVDAHYDTVFNTPGADDNGSGVVGVMEAARLLGRYPCEKSIRFIGFDLEESGLVGSVRYVTDQVAAGADIAGVFNFEMIGYYSDAPNSQTLPAGFELLFPAAYNQVASDAFRGNFITNVGNVVSGSLATLFQSAAETYVPDLKVVTVLAPGNGQIAPDLRRSDHTPFWEAGWQALMLTDGANFRNHAYHMAGDSVEGRLDFTFMRQVVQATVAAAAQLSGIQHGDWAVATFQTTTAAQAPAASCTARAWTTAQQPGMLMLETCEQAPVTLELLDLQGRRVLQWQALSAAGGVRALPLPDGPAGVYVVRMTYPGGGAVQKVLRY